MRRWRGLNGSIPFYVGLLFCCTETVLFSQEPPAFPAPAATEDTHQVEVLIEATQAAALAFKNAQPPEAWETSAVRKALLELWDFGRANRTRTGGSKATLESLRVFHELGRHAELEDRVDALELQEPVWGEVAWILLQEALASGNFDSFLSRMTRVATNTGDIELRGRLWYTIGRVQREQGRLIEAEAAYQRVVEGAPGSDLGDAAKGAIYEMYSLNPGLPAPAFTMTPLVGDAVNLEKLKGKVIVLDFWGST